MDGSRLVLGRRLLGVDLRVSLDPLAIGSAPAQTFCPLGDSGNARQIKVVKGGHVFEVGELKTQ
jgi:hypothetical protein